MKNSTFLSVCYVSYILLGVYQSYLGDQANSICFVIMATVVFTGTMVIKAIKENK